MIIKGRRRALLPLALVATTLIGLVHPASASVAATVMATTQRMTGPALPPHLYPGLAPPTPEVRRISLVCYVRGQSVYGYYGGPSNLWYRVSDGDHVEQTST